MAVEGVRRSTRARKPVKSYAAEQAEVDELVVTAPPQKRKRTQVQDSEDDEDYSRAQEAELIEQPKAKAAKKSKKSKKDDDDDEPITGWTKRGLSCFVVDPKTIVNKRKPKSKDRDTNFEESTTAWHASAALRRAERVRSSVPKLGLGKKETRLRSYVDDPPDSYHKALEKANKQRMFVLDRERSVEEGCHAHHEDCPCETVQMAGSTGDVYAIIISHLPTCTCPVGLFQRNGQQTLCKHTLYVLNKVLKVPDHLKAQNAFLTSELKEIFANAPAMPSQEVVEEDFDGKRKEMEGDCPICFMEFEDGEDVVWCRAACGNNVHKKCFDQWASRNATCPFCRTTWQFDAPTTKSKVSVTKANVAGAKKGKGGYHNVRDQLDYD